MKTITLRVVAMASLVIVALAVGWHYGWRSGVIELLRQDEIMLSHLDGITLDPYKTHRDPLLAVPHQHILDLEQMRLRDRQSLLTHAFARHFTRAAVEPIARSQREELAHIQVKLAELDHNTRLNTRSEATH